MITNDMEFPCVEATRCYITEKEQGLRLSYTPGKYGKVGKLSFTSARSPSAEWYVPMETTTTETGEERILQLSHCQTGHYLSTSPYDDQENDDPNKSLGVGMQLKSSNDSKWIMENVCASNSDDEDSSVSFNLRSMLLDVLSIATSPSGKKMALPGAKDFQLTTDDSGAAAAFEMEFTSGELCFISNPVMHNQIRCHPFGQLSLSLKFGCQEVFRFIEVGNGHVVIASWSHFQTFYLVSDSDGNVFTSTNRLGHQERWYFEKADNGVLILSVAHEGRYLSVGRREDQVLHTTTKPNDYAKWHMEAAHSNTYHLQSMSSASFGDAPYVSSTRQGQSLMSKHKRDWEEWKLERTDDGYITFFSTKHEQFLGSNSSGEVTTTKKSGEWSLWHMEQSPLGGICLKSKAYQRHLAVVKDEDNNTSKLCTTDEQFTTQETWRLEPCLPFFLSTTKIAAMAWAGVLGVALTVVMPYALLGVVELGAVEVYCQTIAYHCWKSRTRNLILCFLYCRRLV
jgi:hypothetical protein